MELWIRWIISAYLILSHPDIYAELPDELSLIQKKFFEDSFLYYREIAKKRLPEYGMVLDAIPSPDFKESYGRNDWLDLFEAQLKRELLNKQNLASMEKEITKNLREGKEILISYYQSKEFARVPFLSEVSMPGRSKEINPTPKTSLVKIEVPFDHPKEPHTLDIPSYVNERFPSILREFLSSKEVPLFAHKGTCSESLQFQNSQGYSLAYRYQSNRDGPESPYILVKNPQLNAYRLVVCPIFGEDALNRIVQILGPSVHKGGGYLVRHQNPAPIFNIHSLHLEEMENLNPETDILVIGYQNTLWDYLKNDSQGKKWIRKQLTFQGADAALYINPETKQRIISTWNVYGDEVKEALDMFYKKGLRRFVYLGTAGALSDSLQVGDILLPNEFFDEKNNKIFSFNNCFFPTSDNSKTFNARQGWISTLMEETINKMQSLKKQGVDAVDVESAHFAEFFRNHKAYDVSIALVVSDSPLGAHKYTEENLTRPTGFNAMNSIFKDFLFGPKCFSEKGSYYKMVEAIVFANLINFNTKMAFECLMLDN